MILRQGNKVLRVSGDAYTLRFAPDRPFVHLDDRQHMRMAELFFLSSVHSLRGSDDTVQVGTWQVSETPDEIVLSLEVNSSIWKRKTIRFICRPERFVYEIEVEGRGQITNVDYFGGYYSGQVRWGSGYFYSGQKFQRGFTPDPNSDEVNYFQPSELATIELTGVPLPGKAAWFFTPPPFCFAIQAGSGWFGLGVEAQPGGNRFTEYSYHGQRGGFHLTLAYEGHTTVDGVYSLPGIGFDFARSEFEVLEAHVRALQAAGCVPELAPRSRPAWWFEPIFCGWGEQSYLANIHKGKAPDFARQSLYESFLETLGRNDVSPGIVVLDDKWQATYGDNLVDETKWPDLRGFIDAQHGLGRRVLLWLKAWDPEGVPPQECITNAGGLPLAVDPSNPAYQARLRKAVRCMLSLEGYNADGFKIDFTARIPSGPSIWTYGDVWGLELMKLYLGMLYEEAKQVKSDTLIMAHTPHPYLADVVDMIRLNDINVDKDVNKAMALRAQVASIACPAAIIDTDNWPIKNKASWRAYLELQPDLGVPSLYFATHIDSTKEPLTDGDYDLIRQVWAEHRARLAGRPKRNRSRNSGPRSRFWQSWFIPKKRAAA